ncbi:MAG: hypothetical protein JWQ27_1686 [Ferruginibacter sp.]|nr:hypothetical protein [Ferruginibacter sp.]
MNAGLNKTKAVGLITAFVLLILSYILLFVNTNRLSQQALWMDHTNKVITNTEFFASEYRNVETSYRAYLAMRRPELKENYQIAIRRTDSLYKTLEGLINRDTGFQRRKLDTVKTIIDANIQTMDARVATADSIPDDISLKDFLQSIGYRGLTPPVVNTQLRQMEYYEGALLLQRTSKLRDFNNSVLTINFASLLIAIVLAGYFLSAINRENKARKKADEQSEQYKKELEQRVKELAASNAEIAELRSIEKFASTGRIARTIAHEVRNPLTNINLATEQLKESVEDNPDNAMMLNMVKRNSMRINQLIADLLNATRFSELRFEKTSLHHVIDSALEFAGDRISLKNIRIEKVYQAESCEVMVDEEKINIAFLNIIINAVEAMEKDKGILQISTSNHGKKCRVTFKDNGGGMSEEVLAKLFEPFFTNKDKGTGLGLTNTQNIILNHKGKIEVESSVGVGTCFTIILNIA